MLRFCGVKSVPVSQICLVDMINLNEINECTLVQIRPRDERDLSELALRKQLGRQVGDKSSRAIDHGGEEEFPWYQAVRDSPGEQDVIE